MATSLPTYTDSSTVMQDWINNIAENYFNFDEVSNYRTGIFGYVNEVMSTVTEDCFNAASVARREFYPTHAEYVESIYRMGALQQLDAPMSTPARVKAILVIKEKDLIPTIEKGEDFYIEDNVTLMVNTIPFMIDHPIIISGSKASNRFNGIKRSNYVYTVRYDNKFINSLDTDNTVYLQNLTATMNGENILLITCMLRQVQLEESEINITQNALIDVVTYDISFSGKIANFEVFYTEKDDVAEIQLTKILMGADTPRTPFVQYMLRNDNKLELHFPSDIYFTPKWGSKIRIRIYTTLGSEGNFDEFKGNINCVYPRGTTARNSAVIIDGQTISASSGGSDRNDLEEFRSDVTYAYATNETICTDNDLQIYFDKQMKNQTNKIVFYKKRDDVFQRLYGAFMLMKDADSMVIPTNTLDIAMNQGLEQMSGGSKHLVTFDGLSDRSINYEDVIDGIRDTCNQLEEWVKQDGHEIYNQSIVKIQTTASSEDYIVFGGAEREEIIDALWAALEDLHGYKSVYMKDHQDDFVHFVGLAGSGDKAVLAVALKHEGFSDFDDYYDGSDRLMLMPGAIFRYDETDTTARTVVRDRNFTIYDNMASYESLCDSIRSAIRTMYVYNESVTVNEIDGDHYEIRGVPTDDTHPTALASFLNSLTDELSRKRGITIKHFDDYAEITEDDGIVYINISYFLYTNPFIISILRSPNAVIYYLNSCDKRVNVDYREIAPGEQSAIQFLLNSMRITRNAIVGENFYTFEIAITPSVIIPELPGFVCNVNELDTSLDTNTVQDANGNDYEIKVHYRAKGSGYVSIVRYEDAATSGDGQPGVFATIVYDDAELGSEKIRVSSQMVGDGVDFKFMTGFTMHYRVSETFRAGDVVATRKLEDKEVIRCMLQINGAEFSERGRYVPLVIEEYSASGNYFVLRGYVACTDEISAENYTILSHGVYRMDGQEENAKDVTITMNNCSFDLYTFIQYDDQNNPGIWAPYKYIQNAYSFTNHYAMSPTEKFSFIEPIEYIRSTALVTYTDDGANHMDGIYGKTSYLIKGVPLVKAQWAKSIPNAQYLVNAIAENYANIDAVYTYLEENFSIDLKFFNTYGRSRFYDVGYGNDDDIMKPLDHVNMTLHIGIKLDTLSSVEEFRTRFNAFVKSYIESINDIENQGRPIYILNLTAACQAEFGEILYMEYYGINDYDSSVQKIVSNFQQTIKKLGYNEYVPEFINIDTTDEDGKLIPSIDITFLE